MSLPFTLEIARVRFAVEPPAGLQVVLGDPRYLPFLQPAPEAPGRVEVPVELVLDAGPDTGQLPLAFDSGGPWRAYRDGADLLLEFLKSVEVETLFLVGDIFDLWAMRKGFFWPQEHNNVVRTILGKAKGGTRVIYIPGNHDEDLREFCGSVFGNLEIHREYVHKTGDGRQLLVIDFYAQA